ncbi:MAG: 2-amino-4-hydroxy-6-hydroxymethyldihydropteridine diphosphokinase [Campylobacterota bacterium]|nr:2-amino-4-hydroxy-6-hydroxymethyldihydropteridine diphosphokinase [Campylobacterota bacterium]
MKKRLDVQHTLITGKNFPYLASSRGGYKVLLGIGGNIGDVARRFEHLFQFFQRDARVRVIETAPILKNPPFGYLKQSDFYNSLMLIETFLKPKALLRYILHTEKLFGRKHLFNDAPRTLDIDMIFYENVSMQTNYLTLPHHGWKQRNSVLIPLSYMKGQI